MKHSSVFRGVRLDDSRPQKWRVQIRTAHFHRRFSTEMEAVAHYNAVARMTWPMRRNPDTGSYAYGTIINSPWLGRPSPARGWVNGVRVIDIDHDFYTEVDEEIYTRYKDFPWFVRDGAVMTVLKTHPFPAEPWWDFEYTRLADLAWQCLKGKVPSGDGVFHINGDQLDNRIANLGVRSLGAEGAEGRGSAPGAPNKPLEGVASY